MADLNFLSKGIGEITSLLDIQVVKNCIFNVTSYTISSDIDKAIKAKHLTMLDSFNVNFSYLDSEDKVNIHIPLDKDELFNNLSVYTIKDGKLVKVKAKVNNSGIVITSSDQNATYIIAKDDLSQNSNAEMIVLISVIGTIIGLCVYAVVSAIKHKNHY